VRDTAGAGVERACACIDTAPVRPPLPVAIRMCFHLLSSPIADACPKNERPIHAPRFPLPHAHDHAPSEAPLVSVGEFHP
jgi:hypothetical protein